MSTGSRWGLAIDPSTWEEVRRLQRLNRRLRYRIDELEERINPREYVMMKLLKEEKHLPIEVRKAICLRVPP